MKIIALLISLLFTSPAWALICSGVPYIFVDGPGNIIYSAQVNANFTTVVNCINTGVATSGVNANITTLTGLTSPPAAAGSLVFLGGSVSGSNAIVVGATVPTGFSYTAGKRLTFIAAVANTGATTLQVAGGAVANLYKINSGAVQVLTGGEIIGGQVVDVVYDGTQFELISTPANTPPPTSAVPAGAVMAFYLSSCPAGWLPANGSSGTINLVGYFVRGLDTGGVVDPTARTLGSIEAHQLQDHTHTVPGAAAGTTGGGGAAWLNPGPTTTSTPTSGNHGSETRPVNVALLYCQKQ
jgi:hypothetical protein